MPGRNHLSSPNLGGADRFASEPQKLEKYFGSTVQFALDKSIPVKKGWLVALTVPTWAPILTCKCGA